MKKEIINIKNYEKIKEKHRYIYEMTQEQYEYEEETLTDDQHKMITTYSDFKEYWVDVLFYNNKKLWYMYLEEEIN